MSLLIVEDEKNLGLTLKERLEREGYQPVLAKSVAEAKDELSRKSFELVLLDVGLPDGRGYEVAHFIRDQEMPTAIIFLTAYSDPHERVQGLELGAQDYMAKPFQLRELILRIQNVLGRSPTKTQKIRIGNVSVNFERFQIQANGKISDLSQKECALLKLLVDKRGKVVSRDEILNSIWSENEFPTTRTVDNFILRLRKLIEKNPENPTIIKSVRGVGYVLSSGEENE